MFAIVQNFAERFVYKIELSGVEPERDRKLERFRRAGFDQRFVDSPIFGKIGTVAIN